jgi:hypothetical protein
MYCVHSYQGIINVLMSAILLYICKLYFIHASTTSESEVQKAGANRHPVQCAGKLGCGFLYSLVEVYYVV